MNGRKIAHRYSVNGVVIEEQPGDYGLSGAKGEE